MTDKGKTYRAVQAPLTPAEVESVRAQLEHLFRTQTVVFTPLHPDDYIVLANGE